MTGQELIAWIIEHNAENKTFVVQFRDEGGDYAGTDTELYLDVNGDTVVL